MDKLIKSLQIEKFVINDLVTSDSEIIFILESPHTDEIEKQYPLAASSGKSISKKLFNIDKAFGLLIRNKTISKYGIMNISRLPLQLSAYPDDHVINIKTCKTFRIFELIRNNQKTRGKNGKFTKDEINDLIGKIQRDFTARVQEINEYKQKKYILCGKFANHFFNREGIMTDNIIEVPHPSFKNWDKKNYADKIDKLKNFIQKSADNKTE